MVKSIEGDGKRFGSWAESEAERLKDKLHGPPSSSTAEQSQPGMVKSIEGDGKRFGSWAEGEAQQAEHKVDEAFGEHAQERRGDTEVAKLEEANAQLRARLQALESVGGQSIPSPSTSATTRIAPMNNAVGSVEVKEGLDSAGLVNEGQILVVGNHKPPNQGVSEAERTFARVDRDDGEGLSYETEYSPTGSDTAPTKGPPSDIPVKQLSNPAWLYSFVCAAWPYALLMLLGPRPNKFHS